MAINEVEHCETMHDHPALIRHIQAEMPSDDTLADLSDLFKIFGDSTRIRILFILFESEVCVCDLAESIGMTQSAVSHQLKILKQNHLVKNRRDGKSILYSLADEHVRTIVAAGLEHVLE